MKRIVSPRRDLILPSHLKRDRPREKLCSFITPAPFVGIGAFKVDAAHFNGTTNWLARAATLTGAANANTSMLSIWAKPTAAPGNFGRMFAISSAAGSNNANGNRVSYNIGAGSPAGFRQTTASTTGTNLGNVDSGNIATGSWYHVLIGINTNSGGGGATGGKNIYMYVNDVSVGVPPLNTTQPTMSAGGECFVGGDANASLFTGEIAEIWYASGQWLDITNAANRRKFISAAGKPVFLGTDGSLVTGTAPHVYLHLAKGEAVANFATNRGTGGNFTVHGTLATASTSPTD